MPKVSVLMPVYKTPEKFLREAIESILAQTFTDFEFLILDDCPADDREQVVKSYADKRIKYAKNAQNMGISASRNKLIDMAQGEYLAIFDHDDISLPKRLEKEVAYLDAHPKCGVVSCAKKNIIGGKVVVYPENNAKITRQLFMSCCIVHSASVFRKSMLNDLNLRYETEYSSAEDYALYCRLVGKTEFHNLPEVLFHYRNFSANTSHLQKRKMDDKTVQIKDFVRRDNPLLWEKILPNVEQISRVKFLGMPLIKLVRCGETTKGYLFDKLPLYTTKTKEVLK